MGTVRMRRTTQISAGLLAFRRRGDEFEVLLAHPGGPFWAKKDDGAWTIPKGLVDPGEDVLAGVDETFGDRPCAIVFLGPERSAGMREQNFEFITASAERQETGADLCGAAHAHSPHENCGSLPQVLLKSGICMILSRLCRQCSLPHPCSLDRGGEGGTRIHLLHGS